MTNTALNQALQTLERATSTTELVKATQALCALNDLEAAKPLVKVLGFNNPAVAAVATQGLIQLGRDIVPILLVLSLIHISEPTDQRGSRMPSSA